MKNFEVGQIWETGSGTKETVVYISKGGGDYPIATEDEDGGIYLYSESGDFSEDSGSSFNALKQLWVEKEPDVDLRHGLYQGAVRRDLEGWWVNPFFTTKEKALSYVNGRAKVGEKYGIKKYGDHAIREITTKK